MDPTLRYCLDLLGFYGWVLLIPIAERLWYVHQQPFWRPGLISDIFNAYQPLFFDFTPWAVAVIVFCFPVQGNGLLQGSLREAHWIITLISLILMSEITFYITHYYCHTVPWLWQFHRVHHSSTIVDSFSTSRFHVVDKTLFASTYIATIIYFAPDPDMVFLFSVFQSGWDRYGHSCINGPHITLYFFSTPHFHRWHHSVDKEAINKNFSRDFLFMDYLLGTAYYPRDKIPGNFGEPQYSNNFIVQQVVPFVHLYQMFKGSKFYVWGSAVLSRLRKRDSDKILP